MLLLFYVGMTSGFSSALTPTRCRAAVASFSGPPQAMHCVHDTEYQLNQGKAIDVLRRDYPRILTHEPDFSIYDENIQVSDPSGPRLSGITQYHNLFKMLRFLRSATMTHDEIGFRIMVCDDVIRIRWTAKLQMRGLSAPFHGLVYLDGVSAYELNSKGMIHTHRLENIVLNSPGAQPIKLAFAWPTAGQAIPEPAMPFFVSLGAALEAHSSAVVSSVQALQPATPGPQLLRQPSPRAPPPRASGADSPVEETKKKETPMERAAREREEMAAEAKRLKELRTPKEAKKKGGRSFNLGLQTCETNFDCERPLICCDLAVAKFCCGGGMMIGVPPPSLQRVPIPIPVRKDPPFPDIPDRY